MDVLSICMIGVTGAMLSVYVKHVKAEYGILLSMSVCIVIILYSSGRLSRIAESLNEINSYLKIDKLYFSVLLKMIGITYISEFAADICRDSGHSAVANQIQVFGKLTIMAVSMPVFLNLLDTITNLW